MFSVVSWNLLADSYVKPEYYPHTDRAILDPKSRGARLIERLRAYDADVLCLQEIEPATFARVQTELDAFAGHFVKKRGKPDGCSIFVRRSFGAPVFRELFYSDATGHVAVAAIVSGIGFASTHLKWEPPDVPPADRLGRRQLAELLAAWVKKDETWIVCGDLNAPAGSPVLDEAAAHGLRDAYVALPDACTCNSNDNRKRIDFILHSPDLEATPSPLPRITDVTPLPSVDEPSDHLAIRASLTRTKAWNASIL